MKHAFALLLLSCLASVAYAQDEVAADSISAGVDLDEIVVTGKRPVTKFTDTGLIYDLQADQATRAMSLMEALRRVPMVTVTADDEIRVKGSANFSIYLNGRPYRVAQADPKTVLSSIPANTIAKVELITELDGRYDAEAGTAIINIITVKNALDGYTLSLSTRLNAKPEHSRVIDSNTDGVNLLATKGKVNMMLGYNFTWQNVLNQPMESKFRFFNPAGDEIRQMATKVTGNDGNYNIHIGRLMLEWTPDSLNSLYVDGHAFIDHSKRSGSYYSSDIFPSATTVTNYYNTRNSETSGTAEANVIYRNYYRSRPDMCRFSLGYRFALDPEKGMNDISVSQEEGAEGSRSLNKVDGHLHEHTVNADYTLPLAAKHTLRLGAKDIARLGKTRPSYMLWSGDEWIPVINEGDDYDGAMDYNQNVAALYAAYNGTVGKFSLSASLRGEYASNSFHLLGNGERSSYDYFDLIPRVNVTYNQSPTRRYEITYNTSVNRPGIGELDPFRDDLYSKFLSQGNPDLRQSRTHCLGLSMLNMGDKLVLQASASVNRDINPITSYYLCNPEEGRVVRTSINFARRDYMHQGLYLGYDPISWLSLTFSGNVNESWFKDKSLNKKCFGVDWNLYLAASFTLPRSWTLGAQLMCNRMYNDPYTICTRTMVIPAFYANKRFLDGKLTLGVTVSSPFAKYNGFGTRVEMPQFTKSQHNDILSRGIAVNLTYRLSSGKSARLDRDTSLRNEDMETGVE